MKVGTDGVLLGAWADVSYHPGSVLDIGAGTGLLALMLAQRSEAALIDAIEIDEGAYEQCVENFENSPWGDRLFCYHAGLDEFVEEIEDRYDFIISNPPFYDAGTPADEEPRNRARHNFSLPFEELLEGVSLLLTPEGRFNTIIPYTSEASFITLASHFGLFPNRLTRVKGHRDAEIKRSLLEFTLTEAPCAVSELVIEESRHHYTDAYIALTKDFYLKL